MTEVVEVPQESTQAIQVNVPQEIHVNADKTVDFQKASFRFKKDKMGNTRPKVELDNLPVPSYEGIVQILENGGKELELLRDAMYDVVRGVVSEWVAADEGNTKEKFNPADFSWAKIATMPKEDRRSSQIPDETWKAFAEEYIEVMPGATGKSKEAVANAVEVYLKKFSIVKTNKPVLTKLKEQLGIFMEVTKKGDDFQDILDLLLKRLDTYLAADDVQALIANL
jgi:hypothetical protein